MQILAVIFLLHLYIFLWKILTLYKNGDIENMKRKLFWEFIYMIIITAAICSTTLLYYQMTIPVMATIFVIALTVIIIIWKKPMSRNLLLILNILNVIAVACFAYFLVHIMKQSPASIYGFIAAVITMDVFSFTKRGKNTMNAKLMNNTSALPRLSICLPVPKKPGLQPIIGIGDLNFYSVMTLFALNINGFSSFYIVTLLLVTGQLLNILVISLIKNKTWYRGFPATLFPGLIYLIGIIIM